MFAIVMLMFKLSDAIPSSLELVEVSVPKFSEKSVEQGHDFDFDLTCKFFKGLVSILCIQRMSALFDRNLTMSFTNLCFLLHFSAPHSST